MKARGQWVSIETLVRTWDGDGLDAFLSSLVEDFRGWEGARACRSLERDLTISAEHHTGGYVVGYPRSTSVRGVALRDHHRARGRRGDAKPRRRVSHISHEDR
ncbi:DUF6228 family protein [Streptomyces sp. NPDC096193]|uniref:DUF6228 family protein n=1 Tax=Streptomyces sp. NPDC096193 TaxID=3155821 RepID=UPI0033226DD9